MNTATNLFCSIVIPAYNVERYIQECLDSVSAAMKQSDFEQTEIIVVDDGSTDGTGRIADECAARFPNLRVIHQANAGVSRARNNGVWAAAGKYIIFADADDYFPPNSLSIVCDYLRENSGVDFLEYDYYELQDGTITAKSGDFVLPAGKGQDIFHLWNKASLPSHMACTRAVSRELMLSHNLYFYEGIVNEDAELVPRVFAYAQKAAYLPVPVYVYRVGREGSTMTTINRKLNYDLLKAIDSLIAFDSVNNFSEQYSLALKRYICSEYWVALKRLKMDGTFDDVLAEELKKRMWLIKYSDTMHRRVFYYYIIKIFGVKAFYMMKYGRKQPQRHR